MKNKLISSLAVFTVLGIAQLAQADEMGTRNWKDWDVTIGAGVEYEPVSPGVDEYEIGVLPYVDIEYKKRFFLKSERGLGAYILRSEEDSEYGFGIALGYDEGRDESDARTQLEGLGDIDASLEAILFFEGELGPVELELELAQGLDSDGHDGFRAEFSIGIDGMITDSLYLGGGPFITFADEQYIESYYGVTAEQAAQSSRYNQYDVSAGFESFGVEVNARYMFTKNWSLLSFAEYTQLMGDAADSPIVDDEGFLSFGAAIAYTF